MNKVKNFIFRLIVFLAGVLFIVLGCMEKSRTKNFVESTAVVSQIVLTGHDADGDPNYTTLVKYTVDGVEYEGDIHEYSAGYKKGKEVKIKYNAEDPTDVSGNSFMSNYAFIGAGALFTLLGAYLVVKLIFTGR